jgi:7TM receptor with intracellular metal dependent phosphohydrolase
MKKEAKNERLKRRAQRMQEAQTPGQRARRERNNRLLCIISGVLCYAAVLMIMLDAVAPQKYRVEVGEIAQSTIYPTRDVMDQVSYEAERKAAQDSVGAIYRIDDGKLVSVRDAVTKDFSKVKDARAQAIAQRNDWLEKNPGSTVEQHQFSSKFISMLMGNLSDISYASTDNERLNEDDMLVIINTNLQDIDAVEAFIKERIKGVMAEGLSDEALPGKRNGIIAALNKDEAYSAVNSVIKKVAWLILKKDLSANYSLDETATDKAKLAAANGVKQEDFVKPKNEPIVRSGEIVTQAHIAMLEELGMLENENVDIKLYLGVALLTLTVLLILGFYIAVYEPKMIQTPKKVLMLAILTVLSVLYSALIYPYRPGLAQIAICTVLVAVLLKPRVALVSNMALSVLLGVMATSGEAAQSQGVSTLIVSLIAGTAAVYLCKKPMHRMRIMLSGLVIGATGGLTSVFIGLVFSSEIKTVLLSALWPALAGAISAVLCVGTLPVWEAVFDVLTPTKLLEITNPNQPLLRRLAIEAPGTHHHSIVVANLAESGAQAIGADIMLTRAGAYYHDVGKLAAPEAYTENQDEKLKSFHSMLLPAESAAIIRMHPTEGYELAQKYKLPKEICNIILEHHGTTLVGYFYAKALEMFDDVNRADFMYPGPKPRSAEAAVIMLADSAEAAVRSLPDKSPECVREKINQILNDRISDGQFDECDISMLELRKLAAEFTQALSGVHHSRIEYPDLKKALEDNRELKEKEHAEAQSAGQETQGGAEQAFPDNADAAEPVHLGEGNEGKE